MLRFLHKRAVFLYVAIVLILLCLPGWLVMGASAADKSSVIDIKATHITNSGFSDDENLITTTNTLNRGYYDDPLADINTNSSAVTNFNWCERPDDAVDPAPDNDSNSELTGAWVTWDTNYVYFAVRGQAKGRHNNLIALLDSDVTMGAKDFNNISHNGAWKRDILFDEGIVPNIYLGFWCADNAATYDGTSGGGNTHLQYGDGLGSAWTKGSQASSPTGEGDYFSWYNGTAQSVPSNRLWIFKVNWSIITTNVSAIENLELRATFASTGPDNGSLMYDYMPETQYQITMGATHTIQNNFFKLPVFDASGQPRIGVSPRDEASIPFYPGSRWDVPNFPGGNMPIYLRNDVRQEVKAFSPNGDGINDTIKFSFKLEYRRLLLCKMRIYDLKGRQVTTLFEQENFDYEDGGIYYNGPADNSISVDDSRLEWDGTDDDGEPVPMGIYIAVFEGSDGTIPLLSKRSLSVIR